MPKTNPLGFRVEPEVKKALEEGARADRRSVSSLVEKILVEWLEAHRFLPASDAVASPGGVRLKKRAKELTGAKP